MARRSPVVVLLLGALFGLGAAVAQADDHDEVSDFAAKVVRFVLLHELAHALANEFASVPVLGNEEQLADAFAAYYLTQYWSDPARTFTAAGIITARAESWKYEHDQDYGTTPETRNPDYDLWGEHDLDIRRAYRALCMMVGFLPDTWTEVPNWAGFLPGDADDCEEEAVDLEAGWERALDEAFGPGSAVNVVYGDDADGPMKDEMAGFLTEVQTEAGKFRWSEKISIRFEQCGGTASWSSKNRWIRLCDSYVTRFNRQGEAIESQQ